MNTSLDETLVLINNLELRIDESLIKHNSLVTEHTTLMTAYNVRVRAINDEIKQKKNHPSIEDKLSLCTSTEEADKLLSQIKMTKEEWLKVAERNDLYLITKTITAVKQQLVLTLVGARLNSAAIRGK